MSRAGLACNDAYVEEKWISTHPALATQRYGGSVGFALQKLASFSPVLDYPSPSGPCLGSNLRNNHPQRMRKSVFLGVYSIVL